MNQLLHKCLDDCVISKGLQDSLRVENGLRFQVCGLQETEVKRTKVGRLAY